MRRYHFCLHREGVLQNGRLFVFLFCRCICFTMGAIYVMDDIGRGIGEKISVFMDRLGSNVSQSYK